MKKSQVYLLGIINNRDKKGNSSINLVCAMPKMDARLKLDDEVAKK